MRLVLLPCFLALAVGCPGGSKDSDSAGGNDSGDTADIDLGPPGCINLNGEEGDFATITAALEYAAAGDTVNVCAGTYTENVLLDVGVYVVGAGSGTTFIDAPVNEAAFDISGSSAGVSGFTITSTRSGITVDQASDVAISDVVFSTPANYGIEANQAVDLSVSASAFNTPVYGGMFLSGGTAVVDGCVFTDPTSYAVWASSDAAITLSNNIFDGVIETSAGADGFAVFGEGASVAMSHNVVTATDGIGVLVTDGALVLDGDLFNDVAYAIAADSSTFSADGVEVYGATTQGIFVQSKSDISVTNPIVSLNGGSTTGLTSCSHDYDAFDGNCGGIYLAADGVTMSGVTVSDYESFGVIIGSARNNGDVTAVVSAVTVENVGRWGFYVNEGTGTYDGVNVTGVREPDASWIDQCTYEVDGSYYTSVDRGAGILMYGGDAVITNSSVSGTEGWGLSLVQSNAEVSGSAFSDAVCAGVINFTGSLELSGSAFTNTTELYSSFGQVFDYQGATILEGNSFTNTRSYYLSDSDDGAGGYYHYSSTGYGRDFYASASSACLIKDNTFTAGDDSLYIETSGCDIIGNTWSGYNGTILTNYEGTDTDPVTFSGNNVTDHAGWIVYSSYGTTTVEDLVVGDLREYSYGYAQTWIHADGTVEDVYSYEYAYGQPAFYAYGYYYMYDSDGDGVNDTEYGSPAGLTLENISMGASIAGIVQASEASLEITDLTAESAGGDVVYAYWSHYAPEVEIDGVEVPDVTGSGISLYGNTPDGGYALISDVSFDVVSGRGVVLTGLAEWTMEDVALVDVGGYGVSSSGSYSYYDYATSTSVYGTREPVITLTGVEVEASTSDSFTFTNGVVSIDSSLALDGGDDGLSLDSVSASVTNNIFATNTGYGMMCVGTTLTACTGNDLGSNTLGAHLDCSDDCSL